MVYGWSMQSFMAITLKNDKVMMKNPRQKADFQEKWRKLVFQHTPTHCDNKYLRTALTESKNVNATQNYSPSSN